MGMHASHSWNTLSIYDNGHLSLRCFSKETRGKSELFLILAKIEILQHKCRNVE